MAKKLAKKKSPVTKKKSPVTKARKKAKVTSSSKRLAVKKSFTKTELLQCLVDSTELSKKKCADVLEALQSIMYAHVKAGCAFSHPGMYKITVVKKPATKERDGINPFTGEATIFRAKPARKVVKIKPLIKLKKAV